MRWLLIGYMFLFIDRPFEVWPWLGDLHLERLYMVITLAVWAVYPHKRWLPNVLHGAYLLFAGVVLVCWLLSPWAERGRPVVEDWFKVLVFYFLVVTTIHDEDDLRTVVIGFVGVMGLYLLHSLREYLGGRHTYRMGIARMIGVDTTLGDPNSFGASIVLALPMAWALWRAGVGGWWGRVLLAGYFGLSVLCVLLTGSRSSLLGLVVFVGCVVAQSRRRGLALAVAAVVAPAVFLALPESLQTRFETIINPEVGPANARESGQGRLDGLFTGLRLWEANPLSGVGPGAWRPATGSKIESHNLYGQLLGELGLFGLLAFLTLLACYGRNLWMMRRLRREMSFGPNDLLATLSGAIGVAVLLLLFLGNFGHNLFRYNWLWYGGFLVIARYCGEVRLESWQADDAEATTHEYPTDEDEDGSFGWAIDPASV